MINSITKYFRSIFLPGIFCFALLANWSTALAVGPDSQTLRYSVRYIGKYAGDLEVVIENSSIEIKATIISHLSTLASLFLTGLTEETWFSVKGDTVYLERGNTISQNNNSIERSFIIDRKQGLLIFDPGDPVPIEENEAFESTAFPMALMISDIGSIEGLQIREVSPKRARAYVYLAPEKEILELNDRQFKTWKVTRRRQDDATRTVTIWLDRNNQQIPLKIVTTKKNKDTVLTLLPES